MDAYEEAYVHLQKVVLLDEKTPLVFSLLAQTSRLAGRRTKALDFIKKELRLYPNSTFAWNECGNIYSDLGRTQDAISSYEKAFSIFPEQIIPALNRCAVLASANRLDEALNFLGKIDLSQAIDLDKVKNTQGFEFLNIEAFL
jgi:tetratricopeptide (TPR) repeat protein